jgi:Protein of unknown function with HXXEE motif
MPFEKALWLFPIALTLHNLEESIWGSAYPGAGFWDPPVTMTEFRIAAVLLAILAYGATYWSLRAGQEALATYVTSGLVFGVLLNVAYHVSATIASREYAPGVVTAVLINLPVMSYLLWRMFRERWISWPKALLSLTAVPVAIAFLLILILLWVSRSV